jgi:hypothetical protein
MNLCIRQRRRETEGEREQKEERQYQNVYDTKKDGGGEREGEQAKERQ